MATTSFFAAALALLWMWRGQPYLSRTVFFMVGLFAAISLALLIERPPSDWITPVYESISVVHWLLAAVGAISWMLVACLQRKVRWRRQFSAPPRRRAGRGPVASLRHRVGVYQILSWPFADFDAAVLRWLFQGINETEPLLPNSRERTALFLGELGPVLIVIIYAVHRLRRGDNDGTPVDGVAVARICHFCAVYIGRSELGGLRAGARVATMDAGSWHCWITI